MNPEAVSAGGFLAGEIIKGVFAHLAHKGEFDKLTEEQAKAMARKIIGLLPETLPSPEDLIREGAGG